MYEPPVEILLFTFSGQRLLILYNICAKIFLLNTIFFHIFIANHILP